MAIVPDTKNWTWVLDRPCLECGFDSSTFDAVDVPELVRENVSAWPFVLEREDVHGRPDDETWSSLEYAAHVRDVYRITLQRLELMIDGDDPLFPNWDQDATAVDERYSEQDPSVVSLELDAAGRAVAEYLENVPADAWQRRGRRSDGADFTVETLTKYFIHDPVHHLHDVRG